MKKFEYKVLSYDNLDPDDMSSLVDFNNSLNEDGLKNWDLVSSFLKDSYILCIYKRELKIKESEKKQNENSLFQ